jgi:hypothetical protein
MKVCHAQHISALTAHHRVTRQKCKLTTELYKIAISLWECRFSGPVCFDQLSVWIPFCRTQMSKYFSTSSPLEGVVINVMIFCIMNCFTFFLNFYRKYAISISWNVCFCSIMSKSGLKIRTQHLCVSVVMAMFRVTEHDFRTKPKAVSRTTKLHLNYLIFSDFGDWLSFSVIAACL